VERDYEKKRAQYEAAGVAEYLIVDEVQRKVTWLRLGTDGKYRSLRRRRGALHSKVLPGFWLRPQWLWQRPLPDPLEVYSEILTGTE
jgi:Uma2 family endonuclease